MEVSSNTVKYLRNKIRFWGKSNYKDYPWRSTKNMWHALVAEIMLQRTRVDQVVPVYLQFVLDFPTPLSYLKSSNTEDKNIFSRLGLEWRHEIFQKTVESIIASGMPEYKYELLRIPGIGDYIASAYLSFHRGKREVLIDSNIVRFYGRFFGFDYNNETRRKKWFHKLADQITPARNVGSFNYALLDFSMNICTQKPECSNCPLKRKCLFFNFKENAKSS